MRLKHRTDANQKLIVEHLRRAGLSVAVTSSLGNGFPDLVVAGLANVAYKGHSFFIKKTVLVELKDGDKPASAQKLTPDELDFIDGWKGEVIVANEAGPILNLFGDKHIFRKTLIK